MVTQFLPTRIAADLDAPLYDSFGRKMESLRISVTDRCNFRCMYCMPAEGLSWMPDERVMSVDEIERLGRLLARMGIKQIRLTGGEPTVRADLVEIVGRLASIPGLESLSLTTNGFLLQKLARPLAEAGLTRVNVSVDSLDREKFHRVSRRDALDRVLAGLIEAGRYPSLAPIKVNTVAIRDFTEEEALDFAALARRYNLHVRFIEFMPLDAEGAWSRDKLLPGRELHDIIHAVYPLAPIATAPSSTSRCYGFADGGLGEIGFINPVSEPFCATCDRIRLTADGQLRTCLFAREDWNLLAPLRAGEDDAHLARRIRAAVWGKELKHRINEGAAFQRGNRSMSQIGG